MVDESNTIYIYSYDETYVQYDSEDRGLIQEFRDYFTFEAKNAKFHPKYKAKVWDGRIRLANSVNNTIYKGLLSYIEDFCRDRGYSLVLDDDLQNEKNIHEDFDFNTLLESINPIFTPRDYQQKAVEHAITQNRCLLLSPTSSGKSFIIYLMIRYYLQKNLRCLLVVPSVNLVEQMYSDFIEYQPNFDIVSNTHKIYDGADKLSNKPITISTWQSIYDQKKSYFNDNYDVIIVDEAHNYKGDEVRKVLESANKVFYKFGLTGTLDDVDIHRLTIEGLLGRSFVVTTTKEMIDEGTASDISIKSIVLEYDNIIRNQNKKLEYKEEVEFVVNNQKRTEYIRKLALQLQETHKNTLILVDRIEHCDSIHSELSKYSKKVYKINGSVSVHERERIRKLAEIENGIIIVATYGTYSTGINIKNLQNIIFAFAGKAYIRILQSIGRSLRLDGKTNKATLYDIIDDFGYINKKGNKNNNYLYKHGLERLSIYIKSKFRYKVVKIKI